MTNIVNVVHLEDAGRKWYTFGVPSGVTLKKGDYVQVHGNQIARCVTDSAEVDRKVLDMVMRGQTLRSEITGIYTYTKTKDIGTSVADNYETAIREFTKLAQARIRDDTCNSSYDARHILDEIAKELLKNVEDVEEDKGEEQ